MYFIQFSFKFFTLLRETQFFIQFFLRLIFKEEDTFVLFINFFFTKTKAFIQNSFSSKPLLSNHEYSGMNFITICFLRYYFNSCFKHMFLFSFNVIETFFYRFCITITNTAEKHCLFSSSTIQFCSYFLCHCQFLFRSFWLVSVKCHYNFMINIWILTGYCMFFFFHICMRIITPICSVLPRRYYGVYFF